MAKQTGTKDKKKGVKRGLKPKDRQLATTTKKNKLTANQWQNTPQQNLFMKHWYDPLSEYFGDAYNSALQAGYKPSYAVKISAPTTLNKWISEYRKAVDFTPGHIKQSLQQLAKKANNSKSPDDTRLKALETLAKVSGMMEGNKTQITLVQPILNGQSAQPKQEEIEEEKIIDL